MNYPESKKINELIEKSNTIVIVQADNPDADSLGSSLALESILSEHGKTVAMYCPVDLPDYIKYLNGWDRVSFELPSSYDTVIFVDVSTYTLLEKSKSSGDLSHLLSKNVIVIDHHANVANQIDKYDAFINDGSASSAGEVIFNIANDNDWTLPSDSLEPLMSSILGDTQGLSNSLATFKTYLVMSQLIRLGANRPALEEKRREYSKMPETIFKYKAELIKRTKFALNGELAYVIVPQAEINKYSPLYNPAPLIQSDMLQTEKVRLAIVFKTYDDNRLTAAIRANIDSPVAGAIAEALGGGGHDFASGFKILNVGNFDDQIQKTLSIAQEKFKELDTK